jgi:hypothetical protein
LQQLLCRPSVVTSHLVVPHATPFCAERLVSSPGSITVVHVIM